MSVRAYEVIEDKIEFKDGKVYKNRVLNHTPLFNCWHDTNILDMFLQYGIDCTNEDVVGEFTLFADSFEEYMENDFDENILTNDEKETIKKIIKHFTMEEELIVECW